MIVKQIYTQCLAQASYYIESDGESAVIDPIRDIDSYVNLLDINNSKLKFILETHFHADFISGHLELNKKYGVPIIFSHNAEPAYDFLGKKDGEIIEVGKVKIKIIHTPGHTLESVCYLLIDENGNDHALFTGDTLFIGDVGIPDVAQRYQNTTKEELASILYESLEKLMLLGDNVIVYPGHGKGTQCGKNLSSETSSTIGKQKRLNYALNFSRKEDFIKSICSNIPEPPDYFIEAVNKNANGYIDLKKIINQSNNQINQVKFLELLDNENYIFIDTRNPDEFAKKHIKKSINIGLNGSFAISAGNLIKANKKIILICKKGREKESIIRLSRVGFDNIIGYLDSSIDKSFDDKYLSYIPQINSLEVSDKSEFQILDVRTKSEYDNSHLSGSMNLPLYDIIKNYKKLDRGTKYLVHCQTGYRSMIASSILRYYDFDVVEIKDGLQGFIKSNSKELIIN